MGACKLVEKGILVDYVSCHFCGEIEEPVDHIFMQCSLSMKIRSWFSNWSGLLPCIPNNCDELKIVLISSSIDKKRLKLRPMLISCELWSIWKTSNGLFFKKKRCSPLKAADDIQIIVFNWVKNRSKFNFILLFNWCISLLYACNV